MVMTCPAALGFTSLESRGWVIFDYLACVSRIHILYVYSNFSDFKTADVRWSTWQSTMGGTYMVRYLS